MIKTIFDIRFKYTASQKKQNFQKNEIPLFFIKTHISIGRYHKR